jgi:hypothetical protein
VTNDSEGTNTTRVVLLSVIALLMLSLFSTTNVDGLETLPSGPGLEWEMPNEHYLFINGSEQNPALGRNFPMVTGQPAGRADFSKIGSAVNPTIVEVSSEPVSETVTLNGNVTVRLYASLDSENTGCRITNGLPGTPLGGDTSFMVTLNVGSTTVMDSEPTNSLAMDKDWQNAHEFLATSSLNATMSPGDVISLTVEVEHNCGLNGILWWGTYDLYSSVVLDADILTPELDVMVDDNGVMRIEFTPISPWGQASYTHVIFDVLGPYDEWYEAVHYDSIPPEDEHIDHMESPEQGTRLVEGNRSALTWVGNKTLTPGVHAIDVCLRLVDGDDNIRCHAIGVLRFMVEEPDSALLGAAAFAILPITGALGFIGWLFNRNIPPWPVLVVIGLIALTALGAIGAMPDMNIGESREESAAPSFNLLTHGGGDASLRELLDGKDALVLGVFTIGSPSADLQADDFRDTIDDFGDSVAFAQLMTGKSLEMVDGDAHAANLNGSWPLLIDEADGGVAGQLPTGVADGVVIIDAAGFVVDWRPSSMSTTQIKSSVDDAISGGGRSVLEMFDLLTLLVLMPLLFVGLPARRVEAPEEVLVPFAGWLGTFGAATIGFTVWAVPVSLAAIILGGHSWTFVELVLTIWLGWQAVSLIVWQRVPEIDFLTKMTYNRLPEVYRRWRDEEMFIWDARMGHWFAWMLWVAAPTLIAQLVGTRVVAGGLGFLTGPLMLIFLIVLAGLVTLMIRLIAAIGGPISRLGGSLARPQMARTWGVVLAGYVIWLLVWLMLGPIWATLVG